MPLYKRKHFSLAETPKDLEATALVYQVRFTKEIFCDYQQYLNRINLYRQRVWTCKVTGKSNLTYEEALVSEKRATEKVQQFPEELMATALRLIQFSMVPLRDLADTIAMKLQECFLAGDELYGRKDGGVFPCRISKVLNHGDGKIEYEINWLGKDKEAKETTLVNAEDLMRKKLPYSRNMLKSFIRESTYRNVPWVLHHKLAEKYGISIDLPEDLKGKVYFQNGVLVSCRKKRKNGEELKKNMEGKEFLVYKRRKKVDGNNTEDALNEGRKEEAAVIPIKYPIEDLLVKPGPDDPVFTDRPSPSREFKVPMDCVSDLLMVWDFCSSFCKLLHLLPYSFEDFENAICHKDSNLVLIAETHSALLRLLIKDGGEYASVVQKRRHKLKITLVTWAEYLCDFLDMINGEEIRAHTATIKRGHYGLLDAHAKLEILRELVDHALDTGLVRELLGSFIEQMQELGASRRGEALEEARKIREQKERLKAESDSNGVINKNKMRSIEKTQGILANGNHNTETEEMEVDGKDGKNHTLKKSPGSDASKKKAKIQRGDIEPKLGADEKEFTITKSNKKERKQHYEREMEKRFIRTNPLGRDRHRNRYWWFRRDGRIFVESSDSKLWGYYSSKEELDMLMGSLNCKGQREKYLHGQLEKFHSRICLQLQKRSKDMADKIALEESVVRRSTRVRAPPKDNPANAFLRYVNKWKEE